MTQVATLSERVLAERHPRDGWIFADPIAMGRRSERALLALIHALLPPPPAPRGPDLEVCVALHVRRMLAYMPPPVRLGFVVLTHLLDWSPVWRFQALCPLHRLDRERGTQILKGLATSRWLFVRLMMLAPKAVVLSTYYDQDDVHEALDYAPRPFIRERVVYRESLLTQISVEDASLKVGAAE